VQRAWNDYQLLQQVLVMRLIWLLVGLDLQYFFFPFGFLDERFARKASGFEDSGN
jgi:hypothetical protein